MLTLVNKFVRESLIRYACRVLLHVIWAFFKSDNSFYDTISDFVICYIYYFLTLVALVMDECPMWPSTLRLAFRNL